MEEPDLLHDLPVCLMVGLRLSYLGAPKINFLGQDPGSWVKSPGGCWVRGGSWGVLGKEGFLKGEGGVKAPGGVVSKSERQAGLREQKDRFQQLSVNNLSFF